MKSKFGFFAHALSLSVFATLSAQAMADRYEYVDEEVEQQVSYDFARVVSAKPVYDRVEVDVGREVCRNERVRYQEPNDYAPRSNAAPVMGMIIGGLIGNQFGRGHGRTAATVAGAALGSAIAEDADNQQRYNRGTRTVARTERVCEYRPRYETRNELVGYDVTYDYKGQIGRTRTQSQPGNTIRVEVAVTAIED